MTKALTRLFRPKSIAVVGGSWAENVVDQCDRMGFPGQIWSVNPNRKTMAGRRCFAHLSELPEPPDAAFLAVNRHQAIDAVHELSARKAGGVVCFASGFKETGTPEGESLQSALAKAAGEMPLLGPNCYGFVNGLDKTPIWPDVHGMTPVDRGVALISQSSNIAINLTMQKRGLPLALTITAGNGAMLGLHDLIRFAASQPEVSAIGLYVEGFGDAHEFHAACAYAHQQDKPVVVLKVGASEAARAITMSHTASLAGADEIATAFLERRCAVGRVSSLDALLEALKLLHFVGPLPSTRIASMSSSGGEAGLISDTAQGTQVTFDAFDDALVNRVKQHCHPLVHVSNPFDYHTFDWGNFEALSGMYAAVMGGDHALTALILDWPNRGTGDDASWLIAADAWSAAQKATGSRAVILASVPENMPADVAQMLVNKGIAPMQGVPAFIEAVAAAGKAGQATGVGPLKVTDIAGAPRLLDEFSSKQLLQAKLEGLRFPTGIVTQRQDEVVDFAAAHHGQIVIKACGDIAHKSDRGGVILSPADPRQAFEQLLPITGAVLVETLAPPPIAEALIGVHCDPVIGLCLTFGMGGTLTEVWQDTVTLPLPADRPEVEDALRGLKLYALLEGYRGALPGDVEGLVDAIVSIAQFAADHQRQLVELDINPLMVYAKNEGVIAVDAVIRWREGETR